jgi:hypothetical protein
MPLSARAVRVLKVVLIIIAIGLLVATVWIVSCSILSPSDF